MNKALDDLLELPDPAVDIALARLYRHLPAQSDEEREVVATLDKEHPLPTLDDAIDSPATFTAISGAGGILVLQGNADVDAAARRLAAILSEESAEVLTAYDHHGGYGHPDHIQVHRVGLRAAELAGTPVVLQATMNRDHVLAGIAEAREAAEAHKVGDPQAQDTVLGPVVSDVQYNKIQRLIEIGIEEGALLVSGGPGRPEGLNRGYYVRPTVFGHVTPDMTIAREEIFGPVLSIMPYGNEEEAIAIANDTVYGLAAYVQSSNIEHARAVSTRLRAGSVYLNYPEWDTSAPFGGYKQSGNGREYADWGIHDFLEIKGIVGWGA